MENSDKTSPIPIVHIHGGGVLCGVATHILTLIKALPADLFAPELVLLRGGKVAEVAEDMGIKPIILGSRFTGDPSAIWRLHSIFKRRNIRLLHTHTLNGNFYGRLAAVIPPRPQIVTSVHTFLNRSISDFCASPTKRKIMLAQNKYMNRLSSRIISPSVAVQKMLTDQGVPDSKITVIPNGIELTQDVNASELRKQYRNQWGIGDDQFVIGAVGRFVPQKNLTSLIEILGHLPGDANKARLMLIGDGPERAELEKTAKHLGIDDKVIFTGWQPRAKDIMYAMDIFVLPSLEENFPYAVLEAMYAAKPVIAFDTGAMSELILDGETGFLASPANVKEMSSALAKLMNDDSLAATMGAAGHNRVREKFSLKTMADQISSIYLELV